MDFNISETTEASTEESTVEWVRWFDEMKENNEFNFTATSLRFNEEKKVFYLIGEDKATSVYCENHPASKFQDSTPHGVRLANAIGRVCNLTGAINADTLVAEFNRYPSVQVLVKKTSKGVLWTVIPNALETVDEE